MLRLEGGERERKVRMRVNEGSEWETLAPIRKGWVPLMRSPGDYGRIHASL